MYTAAARAERGGFTLIELMIVIAIIAIIAAIAIPKLIAAKKSGQEASAVATMRAIHSAQHLFFERDADEDGRKDYAANLGELELSGLLELEIDPEFLLYAKSGYFFLMVGTNYSYTAVSLPWDALVATGGAPVGLPVASIEDPDSGEVVVDEARMETLAGSRLFRVSEDGVVWQRYFTPTLVTALDVNLGSPGDASPEDVEAWEEAQQEIAAQEAQEGRELSFREKVEIIGEDLLDRLYGDNEVQWVYDASSESPWTAVK